MVLIAWRWLRVVLGFAAVSALVQGNLAVILPLMTAAVAIAAPLAVLAWRRFRYQVTARDLVVERGVLFQQRRVVPIDRIRGVDQSASVLHRILGLVEVSIDAAASGGAESELSLIAVTERDAERLRAAVLDRRRDAPAEIADGRSAPADPVLAAVSTPMLALGGATSARWLLAPLALLGAAANIAGDLRLRLDEAARDRVDDLGGLGWLGITGAGVAVLLLAVALAAGGAVIVDGGFTLRRGRDRLTATRGLLQRRSVSISPGRISALELRDSPVWRLLGLRGLRALVTGVGAGSGDTSGRTALLPVAAAAQAWRVTGELDPRAHDRIDPHPPAARRRRLTRACALPAIATAALLALGEPWWAAVAALATVAMAAVGVDRARSLGHRVWPGRIAVRQGSLSRRHTLIRTRAIVDYRVTASPFQRRAGLCTLTLGMGRGAGARSAPDIGWDQAGRTLIALDRRLIEPLLEPTGRRR